MKKYLILLVVVFFGCNSDKANYGYYPNGNIQIKVVTDDSGNTISEYYYENGNLHLKYFKDKNADGYMEEYDSTGVFITRCDLKKDMGNGLCKHYFPNGKIKFVVQMKDFKANGIRIDYDSIGNMEYKGELIDNEKVGHQYFYKNGEIYWYEYYYLESKQSFAINYLSKDSFIPGGHFPEFLINSNGSKVEDTCYLFLNLPMPLHFRKEKCRFRFNSGSNKAIIIDDTLSRLSSYGIKIVYNDTRCIDTLIGEITFKHVYNGLEVLTPPLYYFIDRCDTLPHFIWSDDRIDTTIVSHKNHN